MTTIETKNKKTAIKSIKTKQVILVSSNISDRFKMTESNCKLKCMQIEDAKLIKDEKI